MSSCSRDLKDILIEILEKHTVCIAREINDRAYSEHNVSFESFRSLREIRDDLVSKGMLKEVSRDSPYGKPYQFYYLTNSDITKVERMIENKHKLLLAYSKHTKEIGHFGEDLVDKAVKKLGFTEVRVRIRISKKDIDVLCKDPIKNVCWAIECKNRRQQITKDDIIDAVDKAENAASKFKLKNVKAAIVSSSVYNRIPENSNQIQLITTKSVYVPNEQLFLEYKKLLGSWYLEPIENVPKNLIELIGKLLK
jgi:Holliday junction resolvase-like predicted endonuclease